MCAPSRGRPRRGVRYGSTFHGSWLSRRAFARLGGSIEPEGALMDRRTFLAGTGAVVLAAPLAAEAQPAGKVPRIGYLHIAPRSAPFGKAFERKLRELGYVEG